MPERYDASAIPAELKAIPQWCVFAFQPQPGGKDRKIPLIAGTRGETKARNNDPSTLRPFAVALRDAEVRHLRLGFAFTPDLGYFFIDADDVIGPNGDDLRPDVRELADALATYTEVSASGRGLHIIGKGAFPERPTPRPVPEGCEELELYPRAGPRFCVLTGDVLPGFEHIAGRGERLATLFPPRPAGPNGSVTYEGEAGELSESETDAIITWAREYWTAGRRHAMALHLSGCLGKRGVPREQAARIIERAADGLSDDIDAKVQACHDTYEKLEAGEPVSGFEGLIGSLRLSQDEVGPLDRVLAGFWLRTHPKVEAGARPSERPLPAYKLASEIPPERISWVWYGFLAEGKITIIDGNPKLGKSLLTADLAARVSRGEAFPLSPPLSRTGVVLLSGEDGVADTIVPRLIAAGAALDQIAIVTGVPSLSGGEDAITLAEHIPLLEGLVEKMRAGVIIIDPISVYLGAKVNSYRDQDVRAVLIPLKDMVERQRCSTIIVRHLNRGAGTDIVSRGSMSIGFTGAARLGMMIGKDPEDETWRVLAQSLTNISAEQPSLRFRIDPVPDTDVARVVWDSMTSRYTAFDLLEGATPDEEKGARAEAEAWLEDFLSSGPQPAKDVQNAGKRDGHTERTLDRAKAKLGVRSVKASYGGGWKWHLPRHIPEEARVPENPGTGDSGDTARVPEGPLFQKAGTLRTPSTLYWHSSNDVGTLRRVPPDPEEGRREPRIPNKEDVTPLVIPLDGLDKKTPWDDRVTEEDV